MSTTSTTATTGTGTTATTALSADIDFTVLHADTVFTNALTPVSAVPWEDKYSPLIFENIPIDYSPNYMIWDFGDGTTYTGISAEHVYKWPGEYTIGLTILSDTGEPVVSTNTANILARDMLPTQIEYNELKDVIDIPEGKLVNPIQVNFVLSWQNYSIENRPAPQSADGEQHWMNQSTHPGSWMPGMTHQGDPIETPIYTFNLYASGAESIPLDLNRHVKNKYNHLRRDWAFYSAAPALSSIPLTSLDVTQLSSLTGTPGDYNTYELIYHKYDQSANDFVRVTPDIPGAVFTGLSGNATYYYRDDIVKCESTRDLPVILTTELDSLKLPDNDTFKKYNLPSVKYSNIKPLTISNVKPRRNTPTQLGITANGLNQFPINSNKWVNNETSFTVSIQDVDGFNILDSSIFEYNFDIKLLDSTGNEHPGYVITTIDEQSAGYYRGTLNCSTTGENLQLSASLEFTQASGYTTDAIAGWLNSYRPLSGTVPEYGNLYRYQHTDYFKYSPDLLDDPVTQTITGKYNTVETDGIISSGDVVYPGALLTGPPTIVINDPLGKNAHAEAEYNPLTQEITDVVILSGGVNYTSPVAIYYSNDGAENPVITFNVDNNRQPDIVAVSLRAYNEPPSIWTLETGPIPRILHIDETENVTDCHALSSLVTGTGDPVDLKLDSTKTPWICTQTHVFKASKEDATQIEYVINLESTPVGIEIDRDDNIMVCYADRIEKYILDGTYILNSTYTLPTGNILDVLYMYDNVLHILTTDNTMQRVSGLTLDHINTVTLDAGSYSELATTIDCNTYTIRDNRYLVRITQDLSDTILDFEPEANLQCISGDSRGMIWLTDDGNRKVWFVDVVPEEKPSETTDLFYLTLSYNTVADNLQFNKINYTYYPEPHDRNGESGHRLRATGDWIGFEWLQKFGYVPNEDVVVTGSSDVFNLWPETGRYNIRKQHEDHDHAAALKSYALQPWLNDQYKLWDQFIHASVGDFASGPDDLGKQLFEKISNFLPNNNDIDDCNIDAIHSFTSVYEMDIQKYNLIYPPTLKRVMDLCSIKHKRLYGEFDYSTETYDMFTKISSPETRENLGDSLDFETHVLTPGDIIIAYEKFSKTYTPITVTSPTSGSFDSYGNLVNIGMDTDLVLDETDTFPLSSYSPHWNWNLIAPNDVSGADIINYYTFFARNESTTAEQVEGVINWSDDQNTLTQSASSYDEWIGENNQMDNLIEHQLRVGLDMFTPPVIQEDGTTIYHAQASKKKNISWNSNLGDTALVQLEGSDTDFIVHNDYGRLVWDYQGRQPHTFTYVSETILRVVGDYIYAITFDGYGSILFSISSTPVPRVITDDPCVPELHLTLQNVDDWVVDRGIVEPKFLSSATLKRLFATMSTSVKQQLPSLEINTSYEIALTGSGDVSFTGSGGYEWSTDSSFSNETVNNETVEVIFRESVPTELTLSLMSGTEYIGAVSMKRKDTSQELILNNTFENITSTLYTGAEWEKISNTPGALNLNTLGWLQGFNDYEIYTVFDAAVEPTNITALPEERVQRRLLNFA